VVHESRETLILIIIFFTIILFDFILFIYFFSFLISFLIFIFEFFSLSHSFFLSPPFLLTMLRKVLLGTVITSSTLVGAYHVTDTPDQPDWLWKQRQAQKKRKENLFKIYRLPLHPIFLGMSHPIFSLPQGRCAWVYPISEDSADRVADLS